MEKFDGELKRRKAKSLMCMELLDKWHEDIVRMPERPYTINTAEMVNWKMPVRSVPNWKSRWNGCGGIIQIRESCHRKMSSS